MQKNLNRSFNRSLNFLFVIFSALLLMSCTHEIGRIPTDNDITCLRKQMAGPMYQSFPLAANACQRLTNNNMIFGEKHAKPIPFHLKKAPDLQKLAAEYQYSYTTDK